MCLCLLHRLYLQQCRKLASTVDRPRKRTSVRGKIAGRSFVPVVLSSTISPLTLGRSPLSVQFPVVASALQPRAVWSNMNPKLILRLQETVSLYLHLEYLTILIPQDQQDCCPSRSILLMALLHLVPSLLRPPPRNSLVSVLVVCLFITHCSLRTYIYYIRGYLSVG